MTRAFADRMADKQLRRMANRLRAQDEIETPGASAYVRRDGTLAFTGDQSLGGNDLTSVGAINGGTGSGDDLTLESTSHATKGDVLIQPNGGNVGIGTTSPQQAFHVVGGGMRFDRDGAEPFIQLQYGLASGEGGQIRGLSGQGLRFTNYGSGSEWMRIDSGGKVGIGISSPTAKVHIDQASTTAAIPVLTLDQADLSHPFIAFQATVGSGNPINTTALGSYYGRARVHVVGVGDKWIALYD